ERELRCGERALGCARAHAGRAAWLWRRGDRIESLFRRRLVDAGRQRDNGSVDHVQPAVNGECKHPGLPNRGAGMKNLRGYVRATIGSGRLWTAAAPEER